MREAGPTPPCPSQSASWCWTAGELIFALDLFVLQSGDTVTRTYDVPGRELVVFATAGAGLGGSGVDFGVLGFGPRPCAYEAETEEAP
jgi:hypothetical protein